MNKKELITYRDVQPSDMSFIYRSVLMGTYHGNRSKKNNKDDFGCPIDFFSSINQDIFMKEYHNFLELQFIRPNTSIRVACLVEDNDVILGFSIYREKTLHFVFVKPDWRKIGIATDLVPNEIVSVSGFTRVGDIIRRKKQWSFNPWA